MVASTDSAGQTARLDAFAAIRPDSYALLGALLLQSPAPQLKRLVSGMLWSEGLDVDLAEALTALNEAAVRISAEEMKEEYFKLFIGLGRGIVVPYGCWYLEKMIQSGPLAAIRCDLGRLGLRRQDGSCESEDHAGALCETMALLSTSGHDDAFMEQAQFFHNHLFSWLPRFFTDLAAVRQCCFYQTVGMFGTVFMERENLYLKSVCPQVPGVSRRQSRQDSATTEELFNHHHQRRKP